MEIYNNKESLKSLGYLAIKVCIYKILSPTRNIYSKHAKLNSDPLDTYSFKQAKSE